MVTEIYALDHKVGTLEHDIAVCQLKCDTYGKDKLKHSLRLIKIEHKQLMNQLLEIKSDIEQLIKVKVNYSSI